MNQNEKTNAFALRSSVALSICIQWSGIASLITQIFLTMLEMCYLIKMITVRFG